MLGRYTEGVQQLKDGVATIRDGKLPTNQKTEG
jgi:X-X-X-Leu-X-X-Gly heptad repeat protein